MIRIKVSWTKSLNCSDSSWKKKLTFQTFWFTSINFNNEVFGKIHFCNCYDQVIRTVTSKLLVSWIHLDGKLFDKMDIKISITRKSMIIWYFWPQSTLIRMISYKIHIWKIVKIVFSKNHKNLKWFWSKACSRLIIRNFRSVWFFSTGNFFIKSILKLSQNQIDTNQYLINSLFTCIHFFR